MSDLELKQQDELVNAMIAHYQAIIDGYKKSIEDAIVEIEQHNRQSYHYPCDMISIGTVLQIIRKHIKVGDDNEQTTD